MRKKMHSFWIVDKVGKRKLGTPSQMRKRLNEAANAVANATTPAELHFWAIQAWHWALALQEK